MRFSTVPWIFLAALMFAAISVAGQNPCTIDMDGGFSGDFFRVGGEVQAPVPVFTPDPEYPDKARAAGLQRETRLWVVLNCTGTPDVVKILSPPDKDSDEKAVELDKIARDAVRRWKFQPAMLRGEPVIVQFNVEFTFKLEEPSTPKRRGSVTHSLIYTRPGDYPATFPQRTGR